MKNIIKDREIVADEWQLVKVEDLSGNTPTGDHQLLPLSLWMEHRGTLQQSEGLRGVWLASDEDPQSIEEDLHRLSVIAIHFPSFADGRGYSIARLLRERFGFQGEIRAIGDVMQDQIFYLHRCGFNAFALKSGRDLNGARQALKDFSEVYQAAVDEPRPLFRRRA